MEKTMTDKDMIDKIIKIKQELGNQLVILTHHYQRKEIKISTIEVD